MSENTRIPSRRRWMKPLHSVNVLIEIEFVRLVSVKWLWQQTQWQQPAFQLSSLQHSTFFFTVVFVVWLKNKTTQCSVSIERTQSNNNTLAVLFPYFLFFKSVFSSLEEVEWVKKRNVNRRRTANSLSPCSEPDINCTLLLFISLLFSSN